MLVPAFAWVAFRLFAAWDSNEESSRDAAVAVRKTAAGAPAAAEVVDVDVDVVVVGGWG